MAARSAGLVRPSVPNLYAKCRSLGHEWHHEREPITDADTKRPFAARERSVGYRSTCPDCTTERIKWITRSGAIENRYTYPDGYSLHGDDRLSAQEWRTQFVANLFEQFEQAVDAAPRRTTNRKRTAA